MQTPQTDPTVGRPLYAEPPDADSPLQIPSVEYWVVSNETNTDVRMYTRRIYSYVVEDVVCGSTCCTSGIYTLTYWTEFTVV